MKNRSLDQLIKSIQDDKAGQSRGQLRIFVGYAAGVGKTYAMLKAAHAAKRRGVDVVAGFVETHGRPRTQVQSGGGISKTAGPAGHGKILHDSKLDGPKGNCPAPVCGSGKFADRQRADEQPPCG